MIDNYEFLFFIIYATAAVAVIIYRPCGPMTRRRQRVCVIRSYFCYQFRRLVGTPATPHVHTPDENVR